MPDGPDLGDRPVTRRVGSAVILADIILLTLNLRPAVTGVSPILDRVSPGVGLSVTQAGLLGSLPPFCFAAAGLLGPRQLRRRPPEHVALAALVVMAAAELARPFLGGAWAFLVLSAVALAGMGTGNVVLPVLVKTYFPHRIAAVTSAYVCGVTAGTALPPLLAVPVANAVSRSSGSQRLGWQVSLAWWGAFAALVAVLWLLPSAHPLGRATVRATEGEHRRPVWRSRTAIGLMLVFGSNSLITYALFAWMPPRLVDAGVSDATAGTALAVMGAMGIPCSLAVPAVVVRNGNVRNAFGAVLCFAACFVVGLAGLWLWPAAAPLGWAVAVGLGSGLFPLALALVGLRSRTPAGAALLSGFAQGGGYLLAGLGPLVVGVLHEWTGGWSAPFVFLLAALGLMSWGGWLSRSPATVEDDLDQHGAASRR